MKKSQNNRVRLQTRFCFFYVIQFYLLKVLIVVLVIVVVACLWSVLDTVRRLKRICPRRKSNGVVRDEDFEEERIGRGFLSARAELRRRLWFDETQEMQVDDIPARCRSVFVGFANVVIAVVVVVEEEDVVLVCWWVWFNGFVVVVELFRRMKPAGEFWSTEGIREDCFLPPQHRNGKERVVGEDDLAEDFESVVDKTFFSCSIRNGRIDVAKNSDDDDDRVIEMTGGGGLLVILVIDFYVNDDDDNDNDEEPRIGIHARNVESNVACCWRATRGRARFSLSPSLSLSVSLTLSRYFYYSLLLLMMMMREGESNDDAAPGGRGTQHNKTQ